MTYGYGQTTGRPSAGTGRTGALLAPLRGGGRVMTAGILMLSWVALLWVLEAVDVIAGHRLDTLGIVPRKPGELVDIVPSAFTHFGFEHVASNSLPLLVLGFIAALRGIGRFLAVAFTIIVIGGLGVWLVAPAHTNTAGASGLIFGLFGYLLVRGFVDRRPLDIVVGVIVGALYGSILWGVLPTATGVSWQGHLFGLIGGVVAAFVFRERTVAVTA
ncbi:Membrane associated serine protease, rhomboid family [Actinacidiphila alni]|uniref:Membrane associated serine protease, rhomboid family n=2 Tax=Actinacidiphila alni TaxID=380248 RepID=A0A1I2D3Q5_9ACTN|nr:Membrane associated serine protease, rhomboid family [Actinacidiphila alni]